MRTQIMRLRSAAFVLSLLAAHGPLALSAGAQQSADFDPAVTGDPRPMPQQDQREANPQTLVDAPSGTAPVDGEAVFVGAVTISGLQRLVPSDFTDVVTLWVGQSWSPAELASLANAIATRAHLRGYTLASARVEAQRISSGVVVVRIDEGRIDELQFDGPVSTSVRNALEPLLTGKGVRTDELERRLLIAGDIDGTRIASSRFVRDDNRGILQIRSSRDPAAARLILQNAGTKPIGPEQARLEVDLNGITTSDDSLRMAYATTPAQPSELQFGHIRYERRVSSSGTELTLMSSASFTRPGAYLDPLNIKNRSLYAAAGLLQPLLRRRNASFWLSGELGARSLVQWRGGHKVRRDQLTTARLTLYGYSDLAGGRVRVSGTLSQGLDILDATKPSDPLASRQDADGTYTAVSLWTDWTKELGANFSLRFAAQGQIASQPLLIGEETSLGGTTFLRGYDWGERSGDEGAMGSAELRYNFNRKLLGAKWAQLYVFIDGGTVTNIEAGFGGGSLASTGGGMRLEFTSLLGANLEVAVPLSGPRYDTGDRTPKLNLGLFRAF